VELLARLEALRLRERRLEPSAPLLTAAELAAWIDEVGMVMASGRSALPTMSEAIVGHPIKGSWMATPDVYRIYDLWQEVDANHTLVEALLVLGKQVILRAGFAPALAVIARDPTRIERALASLKPLERRLYDAVVDGEVQMDEWTALNGLQNKDTRKARVALATLGLVEVNELHTDSGYHTAILRMPKPKQPKGSFTNATREVLLGALRAAVVADVKEVRKWNDWSADALARALDAGEVGYVDTDPTKVAVASLLRELRLLHRPHDRHVVAVGVHDDREARTPERIPRCEVRRVAEAHHVVVQRVDVFARVHPEADHQRRAVRRRVGPRR
jgi:hypothetical protein